MSIRIEIGERYVVTSDSFQFILHEKKRAESGKNAGQEWLSVVGYYPRLTACLTFCARCLLHAMTTSGAIKARCTGFIFSHPLFSVVYGRALSV